VLKGGIDGLGHVGVEDDEPGNGLFDVPLQLATILWSILPPVLLWPVHTPVARRVEAAMTVHPSEAGHFLPRSRSSFRATALFRSSSLAA
jgi:hypothetical protein